MKREASQRMLGGFFYANFAPRKSDFRNSFKN